MYSFSLIQVKSVFQRLVKATNSGLIYHGSMWDFSVFGCDSLTE